MCIFIQDQIGFVHFGEDGAAGSKYQPEKADHRGGTPRADSFLMGTKKAREKLCSISRKQLWGTETGMEGAVAKR